MVEQLAFLELEPVPKKKYYPLIVRLLREYPQLKAALETDRLLAENGIGLEELFPSCTPRYGFEEVVRPMTPEEYMREKDRWASSTERYGVIRAELREAAKRRAEIKRMKVELIERALENLNAEERKLIEMRYMRQPEMSDTQVMMEMAKMGMPMGRSLYFEVKDRAIRKIATVLNFI